VLLLGKLVFAVPIRGALWEVYAAALLFIIANLALGILISTLAKSQFQAMQLAFFVFLPQILLSGFMFPYAGMPKAAQWLAEVLPMTHFIRLIRGVMVRGADLADLPDDMLALGAIAAVLLVLSTRRISKRLD
jgi:ABC-2 type transport system permease protein